MADMRKEMDLAALYAEVHEEGGEEEDLDSEIEKATTEMLTMLAEVASMRMRLKRVQNPFFKERMERLMTKTNTKKTHSK